MRNLKTWHSIFKLLFKIQLGCKLPEFFPWASFFTHDLKFYISKITQSLGLTILLSIIIALFYGIKCLQYNSYRLQVVYVQDI